MPGIWDGSTANERAGPGIGLLASPSKSCCLAPKRLVNIPRWHALQLHDQTGSLMINKSQSHSQQIPVVLAKCICGRLHAAANRLMDRGKVEIQYIPSVPLSTSRHFRALRGCYNTALPISNTRNGFSDELALPTVALTPDACHSRSILRAQRDCLFWS